MKYIDRRLLFPVAAAATVWAQQPVDPATAQAEAALRARVEQFYQLQVDKKFRQAEAFVAEDTKDEYYNGTKQNIKEFSIQQIELLDGNTHARVTIKRKVLVQAATLGTMGFDMVAVTAWKMENGEWVWYIDHSSPVLTPFGVIEPPSAGVKGSPAPPAIKFDAATLMDQVTVDGTSVTLNTSNPLQTITVTNNLPGPIRLEVSEPQPAGVSVEVEKSDLKAGERGAIRFRLMGEKKSFAIVRVVASPLNKVFEIQVHLN